MPFLSKALAVRLALLTAAVSLALFFLPFYINLVINTRQPVASRSRAKGTDCGTAIGPSATNAKSHSNTSAGNLKGTLQSNTMLLYDSLEKKQKDSFEKTTGPKGKILETKKNKNSEMKFEPNHSTEKHNSKSQTQAYPISTENYKNGDLRNISKPYFDFVKDRFYTKGRVSRLEFFRAATKRISTIPDRFLLPGNICGPDSPKILFMVPTVAGVSAAAERLAIRQTWASSFYDARWQQKSAIRLAFFFGSSKLDSRDLDGLRAESATYKDIVVGDFVDSYGNLSLKVAVMITWAHQHCPGLLAAVKVDMDTLVNVDLLISLMNTLPVQTHPNYIFGNQNYYDHPPVLRTGDWAVPENVFPFYFFPRYVYGHSYVISGPALKLLAENFPYFRIVPNEDAFVTGIMAASLNITQFTHPSFASVPQRSLCQMTLGQRVSQLVKSADREKLWNSLKTKKCLTEQNRGILARFF